MDKKRIKGLVYTLTLVAILIAVDQAVKMLVDIHLMPVGKTYPIWEGVFHLTSVRNTGAAFGMFSNSFWFLISARIIAGLVTLFFLIKYNNKWHLVIRLCVVGILAGALGNLIDQLVFGYVRDMFDFRLINFAVFNVADSYITVGAIVLAIFILFSPEGDYIKGKEVIGETENVAKASRIVDSMDKAKGEQGSD
ncbi:MAG TPA: signal peptidase II [Bacillota bacterium]|nr:signal peptidase II [Bacillota bacterium]